MGVVCNVEDAPDDDEILVDHDFVEEVVEHHDDNVGDLGVTEIQEVHAGNRNVDLVHL